VCSWHLLPPKISEADSVPQAILLPEKWDNCKEAMPGKVLLPCEDLLAQTLHAWILLPRQSRNSKSVCEGALLPCPILSPSTLCWVRLPIGRSIGHDRVPCWILLPRKVVDAQGVPERLLLPAQIKTSEEVLGSSALPCWSCLSTDRTHPTTNCPRRTYIG
jgi:hypothetical protein